MKYLFIYKNLRAYRAYGLKAYKVLKTYKTMKALLRARIGLEGFHGFQGFQAFWGVHAQSNPPTAIGAGLTTSCRKVRGSFLALLGAGHSRRDLGLGTGLPKGVK